MFHTGVWVSDSGIVYVCTKSEQSKYVVADELSFHSQRKGETKITVIFN